MRAIPSTPRISKRWCAPPSPAMRLPNEREGKNEMLVTLADGPAGRRGCHVRVGRLLPHGAAQRHWFRPDVQRGTDRFHAARLLGGRWFVFLPEHRSPRQPYRGRGGRLGSAVSIRPDRNDHLSRGRRHAGIAEETFRAVAERCPGRGNCLLRAFAHRRELLEASRPRRAVGSLRIIRNKLDLLELVRIPERL